MMTRPASYPPREWQLIETAPKDGTEIVLFSPRYDHCPIAHWGQNYSDEGVFWGWCLRDDHTPCCCVDEGFIGWNEDIEDGFMPTHWMPLPPRGLNREEAA